MPESKVSGVPEGTPAEPQPKFSGNVPSTPSAVPPVDVEALSKLLGPVIEKEVNRQINSNKDRRFSKLDKTESAVREALATLRERGVQIPADVEQEYNMRERIDEYLTQVAPKAPESGISRQMAVERAKEVLADFKISPNDPAVTALWSSKLYPDTSEGYAEMVKDVSHLAASRLAQPTPTQVQAPVTQQGGVPVPTPDEATAEFQRQYEAELAKIPRGEVSEIFRLKMKYREKGLPVN